MKKLVCLLLALVMLVSITPVSALAAEETVSTEMAVSSVTLRTLEGKEGIFYGASFKLSADTVALMEADSDACYGLALSTAELETQQAWTDGLNGVSGAATVLRSIYYFSDAPLTANKSTKVNSTSLINIINISNDTMTNLRNAATVVYVRPYYCINGQFTYGAVQSCSMQDVAEMVDDYYNYVYPTNGKPFMNDTQKKGLLGMYERFSITMRNWDMPDLIADYEAGNALILEYRREKVLANMLAQKNILWSIDDGDPNTDSITFSIRASSQGVDLDYENAISNGCDEFNNDIITLYEGRIYQGLPYTHASSSLDALQAFSTYDPDTGVYTIQNANAAMFNGGSTNGMSYYGANDTTDGNAHDASRIGNDCWDAVHWAWATVAPLTSVNATQTMEMTPDFGLKILGQDILEEAMRGEVFKDGSIVNTGSWLTMTGDLLQDICEPDPETGKRVYKTIPDTIGNLGATLGNTDGTKLVRATAGAEALYKTYALLKKGDAMVHFANGNGHSIMVVDVNVVMNGNQIDPVKSTITIVEQASGHEERQSLRTDAEYTETAKHSEHTKAVDKCKYCAGYDEATGIWNLDYPVRSRTFEEIATSDYLGVRCAELDDATVTPPAARINDNSSATTINALLTGRVTSPYRISTATLDIEDAQGKPVEHSTIVGLQNAVSLSISGASGSLSPTYMYRLTLDQTAGLVKEGNFYEPASVLAGTTALIREPVITNKETVKQPTRNLGYVDSNGIVRAHRATLWLDENGETYYTTTDSSLIGKLYELQYNVNDNLITDASGHYMIHEDQPVDVLLYDANRDKVPSLLQKIESFYLVDAQGNFTGEIYKPVIWEAEGVDTTAPRFAPDGTPLYQILRNADGTPKLDTMNQPVFLLDENGQRIPEYTPIYKLDENSKKIPVYNYETSISYRVKADLDKMPAGNYYATMTCKLSNGQSFVVRSCYLTVDAEGNVSIG